jgi:MFS family permease
VSLRPDAAARTLERAETAKRAVAVVFVLNGFAFAALISRVPNVKATLDLSASALGLLLLALSAGTLTALPLSGWVVHRIGARRTVLGGAIIVAVGLSVVAAGLLSVQVPLVAVGLAIYGVGVSVWDVAMNVEGADVERRLGRTVMPRFHAGFSLGTVAGALLGAAAAASGFGLPEQLLVALPLTVVGTVLGLREFQSDDPLERPSEATEGTGAAQASAPAQSLEFPAAPPGVAWAWKEPRTLLVGVMVFSFALIEGIANDWLALALVDGHGQSQTVGALGFGVFVTSMTIGRLTGGTFLDRHGRVPVLRVTGLLALAGVTSVILFGPLVLVLGGAVLWGIGASLGFPVGMSAGADDPARSAARVAVVSSIGYVAFLAGPPVVGLLADAVGLLEALTVVAVAAAVGMSVAAAARPLR